MVGIKSTLARLLNLEEASEGADGEPGGQTELSGTDTTDASVTIHVYLLQSLCLPPRHCALAHVRIDGSPPTPNPILLESDETTEHETTNDTDVPQCEQIPVVEPTPGHEVISQATAVQSSQGCITEQNAQFEVPCRPVLPCSRGEPAGGGHSGVEAKINTNGRPPRSSDSGPRRRRLRDRIVPPECYM